MIAGAPRMKTGNICPPVNVRVHRPESVTLRSGRDYVPGPDPLTTVTTRTYWGASIPRQNMADVIGKTVASPAVPMILSHEDARRDERDIAAGLFRLDNGGYVRTVDMGDDVLPIAVASRLAAATPTVQVKIVHDARDERKRLRDAADAMIRSIGGNDVKITAAMRQRALDVIAHRVQVAEYAAR